jgi:transcriptional regulator with XRE-family HTH domain
MTANDRLKIVRRNLRLTQIEFGEQIGLTQGGYADVERGKNGVSRAVRQLLREKFKVNLEWLDTGSGNMFITQKKDEPEKDNGSSIIQELINRLMN